MRYRVVLTSSLLGFAASVDAQQSADPRALVARAERLQGGDDAGAPKLMERALPLTEGPDVCRDGLACALHRLPVIRSHEPRLGR